MNALVMADWPMLLAFAGGVALGIVVGYLLRGWRAEEKPLPAATARPAEQPRLRGPVRSPSEEDSGQQVGWRFRRQSPVPMTSDSDLEVDGPAVLLIDDRLEMLGIHAAYLQKHGYRTLMAENGTTGLAFARAYRPALIVLDHSMPDRTGIEVARELKADPATAHIPILFMTAMSYGAVGSAAIEAGCAAFLPKPVDPSRLLREIEARAPRH